MDDQFKHLTEQMKPLITASGFDQLIKYLYPDEEKRDQIKSFPKLFDDLESSGRFNENDVDEFFEALVICNLHEAASLMKVYVVKSGVKSKVVYNPAQEEEDEELICESHDEPSELLCYTCNERICYGCAFEKHRGDGHQVLTKENVQDQIDHEKAMIIERVSELESGVVQIESSLRNMGSSSKDVIERQFREQYRIWLSLIDDHKRELIGKLESHESIKRRGAQSAQDKIESFHSELADIKCKLGEQEVNPERAEIQLQQLKTWEQTIDRINRRMASELQKPAEDGGHVYLSFSTIPNDGTFVDFHSGTVVGAMSVSEQAAVMVRDERGYFNGVTLTCVGSEDGTPFWTREIEGVGTEFPVVMTGSLYSFIPGENKVVLASGHDLVVIDITKEDFICAIDKTEVKRLKLPDESYITGLTNIQSGQKDTGLLVSENSSTVVHRLSAALESFDTLDCSPCVHSISSFACVDSDVAIIDSARNQVVLVSGDGAMSTSSKLRPPKQVGTTYRAKRIQWDANLWGVIWESTAHGEDEGPTWHHAIYLKDGRHFPSNAASGKCSPNDEVVSLSFIRSQTLVCFSDGTMKVFPTHNK